MIERTDHQSLAQMRECDFDLATVVFVGDWHWRKGPRLMAILAFVFGRRRRFVHLGMAATVAWYRGQPYLIRFNPANPASGVL
ncbi:hypothetical protein O4H53_26105 [Sulfitobacter sp. G21635-S1]|uniref:hypothetical protein n=1 Tax=Sulfitobacter sp. G21635-S1 TaxID=3014043 RepID=UPI0022B06715|nr:hypothetical protein [Sulfitobacter sp. G21635-S1]MCZ4259029.1 hypothetical protein [Sulfitobacter sp. G21635-S1]